MDFKIAEGIFKEGISPAMKFRKPKIYYTVMCDGLFAGGKADKINAVYEDNTGTFLVYLDNGAFAPYSLKSVEIVERPYGYILYGKDKDGCSVILHIDLS